MEKTRRIKILIIRLSALGDTIHTLPAAYAIRKQYQNAQIDWVVEDKASKFVANNPLIDNIYVIKKKERNLKSFCELIKKLRKEKYDIALDFQQLLKSGLILGFCGAKKRITLDNGREFSSIFANQIVKSGRKLFDLNYHVVRRNLDLAAFLGCDTNDIKFIIPDFSQDFSNEIKTIVENLDRDKKTIVLSPATTWDNKHWNIDGWKSVIKEFQKTCNIIITASDKEKPVTDEILNGLDNTNIINLTGKTQLSDLVYIFKQADIVVSPDSGSAHVAWAADAKSIVTLFFATSERRTAPYGKNYFSISTDVECAPCMKKKCHLFKEKNKCIVSISSQNVINIIKKVLQD